MSQTDINIALHQAKMLFVRQTQTYIMLAATLHIIFVLAFGKYVGYPEWAILYVLVEMLLVAFVVFTVGARLTVIFTLIAGILMIMLMPFSFIALAPLKQFQQDREYIDYRRRIALLPSLRHSSVQNLNLEGRIPLVSWMGVLVGPVIMMMGLWRFDNLAVGVLGFLIFGIGILTFNRTNISIRGEKIIITRTGFGGSLRRSNFTVIHRIEITHIDYRHGKLRIRYSFVGTGFEREVIYFGSDKNCKRIVDALTAHNEENVYDIESLVLQDEAEPYMPSDMNGPADVPVTEPQQGQQPAAPLATSTVGIRTLISAIRSNQIGLIKQLLDVGVDPNTRDQLGRTPLQVAQEAGNMGVMELLRAYGATA